MCAEGFGLRGTGAARLLFFCFFLRGYSWPAFARRFAVRGSVFFWFDGCPPCFFLAAVFFLMVFRPFFLFFLFFLFFFGRFAIFFFWEARDGSVVPSYASSTPRFTTDLGPRWIPFARRGDLLRGRGGGLMCVSPDGPPHAGWFGLAGLGWWVAGCVMEEGSAMSL